MCNTAQVPLGHMSRLNIEHLGSLSTKRQALPQSIIQLPLFHSIRPLNISATAFKYPQHNGVLGQPWLHHWYHSLHCISCAHHPHNPVDPKSYHHLTHPYSHSIKYPNMSATTHHWYTCHKRRPSEHWPPDRWCCCCHSLPDTGCYTYGLHNQFKSEANHS